MPNICVVGFDGSFASGVFLIKGLRQKANVTAVFRKKDPKEMWRMCEAEYGFQNIPKADEYIVLSGGALLTTAHLLQGKIKVIITDSLYNNAETRVKIDDVIKKFKVEVFCVPSKWHLCKLFSQTYISAIY